MAGVIDCDILIIGGGIAGPALAAALRRSGLHIIMLERSAEPADTARGDHLQPVAAEILDRWGVLGDLFEAGAEKRLGSTWMDAAGDVLLTASVDDLDIPHPYFLYLNHEKISETLLGAAAENPHFQLIRPIRGWEQAGQAIRVRQADGGALDINARVIVGADGRASKTRDLAGLSVKAHNYSCPFVVLMAATGPDNPRNEVQAYISKAGVIAVVPRTGGGRKIGVPVGTGDIKIWKQADSAARARMLAALVPALGTLETTFCGIYPPVMLMADAWVNDNMVIIGDACHAMHPGRSQGMNVALRCIDALATALLALDRFDDKAAVRACLKAYEVATKPTIDPILEQNHRDGLDIDSFDPAHMDVLADKLRGLASNADIMQAYRMASAGY